MPTDLTGTPTSLGIGTFNTSADAPSGLGFNAAMAQIDALIAARVAKPAGITTGEFPVWNGTTWVRSSAIVPLGNLTGTTLGYQEFTSNVSITGHNSAGANTVVTAPAITFDGSTVAKIEFYSPYVFNNTAAAEVTFVLFQDGVDIGVIGDTDHPSTSTGVTPNFVRYMTPASGSRTYSIRAYASGTSTGTVTAGTGGAGLFMPGFIRVSRA